jgi:S1-C subfamily serine protease
MRTFFLICVLLMLIAGYIYHNDQRGCIQVAHDIASKPTDGAQIMRDLTPVLQTSIDQAKLLLGIKPTEEPAMASTGPARIPAAGAPKADDRAVVVIKGDVAEGTGFLVKTASGPVVITNLHVIFANTNWHILTSTGEEIKTTALYGASDRDLAMFTIQDNNYHYLTLAADVSNSASRDDPVVTPGNSEGGEVILDTPGKVLGIGPERVEISNPVYHGNSGGPIVDKNGDLVLHLIQQGASDEMLEEARVAVLDCKKFGEEDMPGIENPANFYSFEWKRAKEETVYRQKLLDELQQINDRI